MALVLVAGCYDPVHEDDVSALGPDVVGDTPGPTHRAGQPCTTCHGGEGPAKREFSVAGTLYLVRAKNDPLAGGVVTITDAKGEAKTATSNATGNFFIPKSEWSPSFPLRVAIEAEGVRREMATTIGRDGGCAACHRSGGDRAFMPGVFLRDK